MKTYSHNNIMLSAICKGLGALGLGFMMLANTSCINEWPEVTENSYSVKLTVHSATDWLPDYTMNYTRQEKLELAYQFKVYKAGTTTDPVNSFTLYKNDLQREDFTVDLNLLAGDYDIYVWSDICNADTNESLFYDSSNFASITYKKPYEGDSNDKDAFRGMVNVKVEETYEEDTVTTATINLERPFAKYVFIATDVKDFIAKVSNDKTKGTEDEATRDGESSVEDFLTGYTARVMYPLYMPAVFDNFLDRPIDSWSAVSFEGDLEYVSDEEAMLGFDYVMMNGNESTVQVALEIYDKAGNVVSRVNTINIPTKRDRTTIVYGRFLTTLEHGGVSIDPNFEGSFDIQLK